MDNKLNNSKPSTGTNDPFDASSPVTPPPPSSPPRASKKKKKKGKNKKSSSQVDEDSELIRRFLIMQIESKMQAASYYRTWFNEQSISMKILQQKAFISARHYHQHLEKLGIDLFAQANKEFIRPSSSSSSDLRSKVKALMFKKEELELELRQIEEELIDLKKKTDPECLTGLQTEIQRVKTAIQFERESFSNEIEQIHTHHLTSIENIKHMLHTKKKEFMSLNIEPKHLSEFDTSILSTHRRLKRELETVTQAMQLHADRVDQLERQVIQLQEEMYPEVVVTSSMEVIGRTTPMTLRNIKEGGQRFYA